MEPTKKTDFGIVYHKALLTELIHLTNLPSTSEISSLLAL